MPKRTRWLFPLCLLGIIVFAVGYVVFGSPVHNVVVTDAENNTALTIPPETILIVRLTSNTQSGAMWRVTQNDRHILQPDGEQLRVSPTANGEAHEDFRFKASQHGPIVLKLTNAQWETTAHLPLLRYQITVTVK